MSAAPRPRVVGASDYPRLTVFAIAALTGPLPKLGVIAVALLAAAVILIRDERACAAATLAALVLAPVLLLAEIWGSPQLRVVHRHPLPAALAALILLALLALAARGLAARPRLLAPLAVATLPFRIPISVGGATYNLLVPLYFVIGAACLAWLVPRMRAPAAAPDPREPSPKRPESAPEEPCREGIGSPRERSPGVRWLSCLLAAYVVVYAVQASYSVSFPTALRNTVFFYVPFALLYRRLCELRWDRELLGRCLAISVVLALAFSVVAFAEEATKTVFLNSKLIETNELHPYFTVNSVFFDPNIFGRYLALVMILLVAVLLYDPRPRMQLAVTGALVVLLAALTLTLSRSSMFALLFGMWVLLALRWRLRPVLTLGAIVVVAAAAVLAISPHTFGLNEGLNNASGGRAGLLSGGLEMFGRRPLWGYGSGAFSAEYLIEHPASAGTVTASHTIPVTIAAEQGLIGLAVYAALLLAAFRALLSGARSSPARAAVAAAFLALVLHTLMYADFLEDPMTWTLLALGAALAVQRDGRRTAPAEAERQSAELGPGIAGAPAAAGAPGS
jgi:putative inorganic carbon (HCO3(-)) transporter